MRNILENGSACLLKKLEESKRAINKKEVLSIGNHKGNVINPILLGKLIDNDVVHSYGLVLTLIKIDRIPGVRLAPMNSKTQNTIDEHGIIVEKDRLNHNQSYKIGLWNIGEHQGGKGRPSPL